MWVMSVVWDNLMSAKRAAISADFFTDNASLQPLDVMVVERPAIENCSLVNRL